MTLSTQQVSDSPTKPKEEELFPEEKELKKEKTDLIVAEEADTGDVKLSDLNKYLSFSYGYWSYLLYFIFGFGSACL